MKAAIVGAGAEGIGIGSALLAAGVDVLFVTRTRESAAALGQRGLRRTGLFGDARFSPGDFSASHDPGALVGFAPDWILVCTKVPASAAVAEALERIRPELSQRIRVVLCMNGWGTGESFLSALPASDLYHARVITGFHRRDPCTVDVTAHAAPIHLGSLYGGDLEPLRPLAAAIARGGLPCAVPAAVEPDLIAKLLYNCALNPLGALLGMPYGALAETPRTRRLMDAIVREIFAVLAKSPHSTHWPDADRYLTTFYEDLLPPTAAHESSMLQDLRAGRPTEVDAITGAVVALGERYGVETPLAEALTILVHAAEARRLDAPAPGSDGPRPTSPDNGPDGAAGPGSDG